MSVNFEQKISELNTKIETAEQELKAAIQNANMQIAQKQGEINGMRQAVDFLLEQTETESNENVSNVETLNNSVAEG
jgi:uncharacterized coiled-coil protein SlyX